MDETERLRIRADRERRARLAAEEVAERATRELYELVRTLESRNAELERLRRVLQAQVEELSTPLIRTWPGVLTVPVQGAFDDVRATRFTDTVLKTVKDEQIRVLILDLSAIGTVDTYVAERLVRATEAARLMGCSTLFSGVRSDTARLFGALGVEFHGTTAFVAQADAIRAAMRALGWRIVAERV